MKEDDMRLEGKPRSVWAPVGEDDALLGMAEQQPLFVVDRTWSYRNQLYTQQMLRVYEVLKTSYPALANRRRALEQHPLGANTHCQCDQGQSWVTSGAACGIPTCLRSGFCTIRLSPFQSRSSSFAGLEVQQFGEGWKRAQGVLSFSLEITYI